MLDEIDSVIVVNWNFLALYHECHDTNASVSMKLPCIYCSCQSITESESTCCCIPHLLGDMAS